MYLYGSGNMWLYYHLYLISSKWLDRILFLSFIQSWMPSMGQVVVGRELVLEDRWKLNPLRVHFKYRTRCHSNELKLLIIPHFEAAIEK